MSERRYCAQGKGDVDERREEERREGEMRGEEKKGEERRGEGGWKVCFLPMIGLHFVS